MLVTRFPHARRSGAIVVWFAILVPVLMGMVAFAVDVGFMCLARNHLQVAADSGAMGGVGALATSQAAAKAKAKEMAEKHFAGASGDSIAMQDADIVAGTWDQATRTFTATTNGPNAVQVTTRKRINLFFGKLFGWATTDLTATAIACKNPRDIAFVIDLSGSMNNDSEIWATAPINAEFPDYPNVATNLMQDVFTDFGFGTYPGSTPYVGQVTTTGTNVPAAIPSTQYTPNGSGQSPVYAYLANTYLRNTTISTTYRTTSSDSAATLKQKVYKGLIDYQLAAVMPNAKPTPNSSTNYEYWANYLDYIFTETSTLAINGQSSRHITSGSNPYSDAWPGLTSSAITPSVNKVGYLTYVQFMMDFGWDVNVGASGRRTPLSRASADCPWRVDNDPASAGYGLSFPPREQPTHAARLAIMAGINQIKAINANIAVDQRDHVCVITFDTGAGTTIKYPLTVTSCDYDAARASVRDLQATSDWAYSTASENGMITARNHLNPALNPTGARPYSKKILVFMSDGIPNLKQTPDATINSYASANPKGEWFTSGSFYLERNATLMQVMQMQAMGWKTHVIGIGLGPTCRSWTGSLGRAAQR
jgi:Flp pilus assembly protein TadG